MQIKQRSFSQSSVAFLSYWHVKTKAPRESLPHEAKSGCRNTPRQPLSVYSVLWRSTGLHIFPGNRKFVRLNLRVKLTVVENQLFDRTAVKLALQENVV